MLALFASLAVASLLQGVGDIVLPTARGGAPFSFLFATTRVFGPSAFALYVFIHNFGLACLVPGVGFVAARYERHTKNRGVIGILLVGAVVLALLVALEYLLQAQDKFDPAFAFPGGVDTNVLARSSLVTYTAPDTTTRKKSNYVAYYDNFSISTR